MIHLLTWGTALGSTWRRPSLLAASLSALVMGQLDVETFFHSLAQNRVLMFKRLHSALKLLGVLHHPLQIPEISLQARCLLVLLVQLRPLLQHVGGQEQ